jgi:hypothetical protein
MKQKLIDAKDFVIRHKEAFIVGGFALAVISTQRTALAMANDFIDQHGLTEEFIATTRY